MSDPDPVFPIASSPSAVVTPVRWDGAAPVIIDQRALPARLVEWRLASVEAVVDAIASLAVRGAPAIGIAGAYGMVLGLLNAAPGSVAAAHETLDELAGRIGAARPTAVNLTAAVERVRSAGRAVDTAPPDVISVALRTARAIHEEDRAACARIGAAGAELLQGRRRVLTHCHTGRLATGGDGTALGVIYALHAAGRLDEVLVSETRPLLQGARLTAWELGAAGIPYRLIIDAAAGPALASGLVDAVVVGCDRVARNGDTANKIGTYALAILARHHGIPFYVAGPLTSFDSHTATGDEIVIEERSADEMRGFAGGQSAPADAPAWNPAFDVTPAGLVDGFITDVGVIYPPFSEDVVRPGAPEAVRA